MIITKGPILDTACIEDRALPDYTSLNTSSWRKYSVITSRSIQVYRALGDYHCKIIKSIQLTISHLVTLLVTSDAGMPFDAL